MAQRGLCQPLPRQPSAQLSRAFTSKCQGELFGLQNEQTKAIYTYLQHPPPATSFLQA